MLTLLPENLQTIKESIVTDDPERLHRAGHRFKGTLKNLAAAAASGCALKIEQIGRQGKMQEALDAFQILSRECGQLEISIRAYLESEV